MGAGQARKPQAARVGPPGSPPAVRCGHQALQCFTWWLLGLKGLGGADGRKRHSPALKCSQTRLAETWLVTGDLPGQGELLAGEPQLQGFERSKEGQGRQGGLPGGSSTPQHRAQLLTTPHFLFPFSAVPGSLAAAKAAKYGECPHTGHHGCSTAAPLSLMHWSPFSPPSGPGPHARRLQHRAGMVRVEEGSF